MICSNFIKQSHNSVHFLKGQQERKYFEFTVLAGGRGGPFLDGNP
jgi:hypothetical protein